MFCYLSDSRDESHCCFWTAHSIDNKTLKKRPRNLQLKSCFTVKMFFDGYYVWFSRILFLCNLEVKVEVVTHV